MLMPMSRTATPAMVVGNTRRMARCGSSATAIWTGATTMIVPSSRPQASSNVAPSPYGIAGQLVSFLVWYLSSEVASAQMREGHHLEYCICAQSAT